MYFKNNFYSDGIDKFVVITVATEENENLARFRKSCSYYNVPYIVLGLGDEWKSGVAENGVLLEPGGAQKIIYLREELKSWPEIEDHIVMFTDSYDVVMCATPQEILQKFRSFQSEIVFSTEKTCWPDESIANQYPQVDTDYKFLNSGGFVGYANKILEIIDTKISIEDDDQLFYTKVFLDKVDRIQIPQPIQVGQIDRTKYGYSYNTFSIGSMSEPYFDDEILNYLLKNFDPNIKILDVGAGDGKWAHVLNPYFKNIDAVEIFTDYVRAHNLNEKYKRVFNTNILTSDIEEYDVVIFGDVWEHLSKEQCQEWWSKNKSKVGELIVVVPFKHKQDGTGDFDLNSVNDFGIHQQEDLTVEVMLQRYPMLKIMNWTEEPDGEGNGSGFGWFTLNKDSRGSHFIRLDYQQSLFQTLNQAIDDIEQDEEGRFVNLTTGEKPCMVHANGPSWVKKYLKEKSFYMFGEYDGESGSINLLTKTYLPTDKIIYLANFIQHPVSDINQVFDHIRYLDYPKKNIILHLIYSDEDQLYKIQKFVTKYGKEYKEVIVTMNSNVTESHKMVILSAKDKCDFLFMMDCNYIFRNNRSIQLLIEKDLDIIAPMIFEEHTDWVNFGVTPDYIHKNIHSYTTKTVFVVDYITGILVLANSILDKAITFIEPSNNEVYDDYDWDIMFCKEASNKDTLLHVCNMNFYGSIIK
jgi:hypothetical protein